MEVKWTDMFARVQFQGPSLCQAETLLLKCVESSLLECIELFSQIQMPGDDFVISLPNFRSWPS